MASAYPLEWPAGWPRSEEHTRSAYRVSYKVAVHELLKEVRLLGGEHLVISSDAPLRKVDGLPYTEAASEVSRDPGVAVYFALDGEPVVIACDQWNTVKDNIRAIGHTVVAMRMIQRSGATELLRRAFRGFKALPGPQARPWFEMLGVPPTATLDEINRAFRKLAKDIHPDHGGDTREMANLIAARDKGREVTT